MALSIINDVSCKYAYKADGNSFGDYEIDKWKPSIFMPKEACRLFLKVTNVRVERLQDISDDDCRAEGIESTKSDVGIPILHVNNEHLHFLLQGSYSLLWGSLNGP